MKISMPEIPGITSEKGLDSSFKKVRASKVEKEQMNITVVKSVIMILVLSLAMFLVVLVPRHPGVQQQGGKEET